MRSFSAGVAMLALAGCGGANLGELAGGAGVVGYKEASAFSPTGYSVSSGADGRVRITATGTPSTPAARLEKIALARAAEYGAGQNQKMFKADAPRRSFRCGPSQLSNKGQISKIRPSDYRVVQIDVAYSSDTADPGARPTKQTAETLKAELSAEAVPTDVQAASSQEIASNCRR